MPTIYKNFYMPEENNVRKRTEAKYSRSMNYSVNKKYCQGPSRKNHRPKIPALDRDRKV